MHSKLIRFIFVLFALSFSPLTAHGDQAAADGGQQLYTANCAKCHGREGEGFLQVYPPLTRSRYLQEDVNQLPCLMRYGLKGEIVVNGVTFNQIMPGNKRLSDADIEAIITFMQMTWAGETTPLEVSEWLGACK